MPGANYGSIQELELELHFILNYLCCLESD
jgi:hypothetical protein